MTPSFFAVIVVLAGLLASRTGALYWQLGFALFGATAALSLPALGGAVITPANLFLPFLILRAWAEEHNTGYLRRVPTAGVWLGLTVICGVVAAIFVPRFLEGQIEILTIDRNNDLGAVVMPMHPVSGNFTQSGYAIGGLVSFLALRVLLEKPGRLEHLQNAVLLLASLNCVAAIQNLGEFYLGFPKLLDYLRTGYALFGSYEGAGGLMRIHGTFPEASTFAGFSLPLFAFCFSLWLNGVRALYSGTVALLLLVFLLISTSSTAYGGLAMYGTTLIFILTHRGYVRGTVPRIGLLVAGGLLIVVLVGSFFVLETTFAQKLEDYFAITIFDKLGSDSGIERTSWNRYAWYNFLDTYGVGVGFGTARASSLLLVLLSNLGLLGTLFFMAFLKNVFVGSIRTSAIEPVREASRQAVLASLCAGLLIGTVFDLGITFYAWSAAASIPTAWGATTIASDRRRFRHAPK